MNFINYILLGLFWIIICIGLGIYINPRSGKGKTRHTIGLTSIFVFYIVGVVMLFAVIIFS